jgi:hypothetical protein
MVAGEKHYQVLLLKIGKRVVISVCGRECESRG